MYHVTTYIGTMGKNVCTKILIIARISIGRYTQKRVPTYIIVLKYLYDYIFFMNTSINNIYVDVHYSNKKP